MQRVTILCVGKLKEKFYIDAAAEYVKRLQGAAYSPRGDAGVHQKVGPAGADQQAVSLRPTG